VVRIEKREAEDHEGVAVMPGAAELLKAIPEGRLVRGNFRNPPSGYFAAESLRTCRLREYWSRPMMFPGQARPRALFDGSKFAWMNPAECLVIEDAPGGIRAAHAGAMKAIGLTSTYPARRCRRRMRSCRD